MLLPNVLNVKNISDVAVTLNLHIPKSLDYFPGHFPEYPILPGVVQLHWAIHYAHEFLPIIGSFSNMDNIKFQSIIVPSTDINLSLQWLADKKFLEFSFANDHKKFSSGRIVFSGNS